MKFTAKKTANLLETVMEMYSGVSKQKAKQLISYSHFTIDGVEVKNHPLQVVQAGQVVELEKSIKGEKKVALPSKHNPIAIYFEDDYILVGLKPAGILSCHDRNQETAKSFHKHLEAFMLDRDDKKTRLWPVHRLDKEVEGLIIFAKSEQFQQMIKDIWPTVTKKYLALTEGKPNPESGTIESWLKEDHNHMALVIRKEEEGSKFAKTDYSYVRREGEFHLLEVTLHTGRKNQSRAHLSSIGCPIVGDRRYGADDTVNRQIRLAAYKLEFRHPALGVLVNLGYNPPNKFFKPSKNQDEQYRII